MEITVSRKTNFNAAHRLHVNSWSDEKNKSIFGLCNNPNFHGHNYQLIVAVSGEMETESGFLIDLKILKQIIFEEVEEKFDHKNLNMDTDEFKNVNPTAENIAIVIWNLLRKRLNTNLKMKVTLYETERNFVEYNGN